MHHETPSLLRLLSDADRALRSWRPLAQWRHPPGAVKQWDPLTTTDAGTSCVPVPPGAQPPPTLNHTGVEVAEPAAGADSRPLAQWITPDAKTGHDLWLRSAVLFALVFGIAWSSGTPIVKAVVEGFAAALAWGTALHTAQCALRPVHVAAGSLGDAALGTLAGLILVSAAALWLPLLDLSLAELTLMAIAVFVIAAAWDNAIESIARSRTRVLLVGLTPFSRELVETLAENTHADTAFNVIGFVDDDMSNDAFAGRPQLGCLADLEHIVGEERPHLVLVGVLRGRPEVFGRLARVADSLDFQVVGLPEFYEHAFGRLPVRHMTEAWFMSLLHLYQRPYSRSVKRAFDLVVAGSASMLMAPLFLLIATLVCRTPGGIIYRQVRLGKGGRRFTMYKFRTMAADAEAGEAVWATLEDARVTAVGRVLRRTRLDELPQLWNVIHGEMSIVGPRPERPEFLEMLAEAIPFWTRRHLLKPGITGWAQINSGYASDCDTTERKLAYDLWYLRHGSLIVDFLICARTLPRLVLGGGR
jgi:exopolysaccharide biosynthesis polyprenyl glycosylphosphotransferase